MTSMIRSVKEFHLNGWTIRPCEEDGFDLIHKDERYHHDHLEVAVAAAQASRRETPVEAMLEDGSLDLMRTAKFWCEDMQRLATSEARARRALVVELIERVEKYEKNLPSRFSGTPEDIDAWLHGMFAEDTLLKFYQWLGTKAVTEVIDVLMFDLSQEPIPAVYKIEIPDLVDEAVANIDPRQGADLAPSRLPIGKPFCDVPHHVHTDGSRLPTCRLDSEE